MEHFYVLPDCLLLLVNLLTFFRGCVAPVFIHQTSQNVVSTTKGEFRGVAIEFPRESALLPVNGYFGIPFASGLLRFMPPSEAVQLQGVTNANDSVSCPQVSWSNELFDGSGIPKGSQINSWRIMQSTKEQHESCLNLNIFVPTAEWNSSSKFPVMIFVHGESYNMGTGNAYDGSVLSSYGDVIAVTVNYRLGALGFLSTGNHEAGGNYALWDLFAAVSWINDNIGAFGGDKNRVTLFGHGYGAALVNIMLLSPMLTTQLVQRAIIQSGSALSPWAVSFDSVMCTQWLAVKVRCDQYFSNSNLLLDCLRHKTANELVQNVPSPPKYFSCFAPTPSGGPMFPNNVENLIQEKVGLFSKIPVVFGVTQNEAYSYMKQKELEEGISLERKAQMIRTFVHNLYTYHRQKMYEIIDFQYSDWNKEQNRNTTRDNIMRMLGDGLYVAPLIKMAQEHTKTGKDTYLYNFGYSTLSEDFTQWSGGVHGDDLPYIFGAPLVDGISPFPSRYTKNEKKLSAYVMRLWTNFAKSGNPNLPVKENGNKKLSNLEWPVYNISKQEYLHIGKGLHIKHHYRGSDMALWLDLIPKINSKSTTSSNSESDAAHMLSDSNNLSTFDDPSMLISKSKFYRLLPRHSSSSNITKRLMNDIQVDNKLNGKLKVRESLSQTTVAIANAGLKDNISNRTTNSNSNENLQTSKSNRHSDNTGSISFSITVIIGCSLLFINIVIYAGICYHRGKINKVKKKMMEKEKCYIDENSDRKGSTTIQLNHIAIKPSNSKVSIYSNPVYSAISKQLEMPTQNDDSHGLMSSNPSICQVQVTHSKVMNCDRRGKLKLEQSCDEHNDNT